MLKTAYMRCEVASTTMTCNFRLNQSGNLDAGEDHAYIQYQINDYGWVTDTSLSGYGLSSVWFRTFPLTLYYGQYIQFRVIYETNDNTEFWGLQNGDINVSGNFQVYPTNPGTLPVMFTDVSCEVSLNNIIIRWQTASETNNDYFTIERSDNGADFYPIGTTDGAGNSNSLIDYLYTDYDPLAGINFYRIRQTDYDGKYDFSEIVSIVYQNSDEGFTIYSDNGTVMVSFDSRIKTYATLSVTDITGRDVIKEDYSINEGKNQLVSRNDNLIAGIYLVYLAEADGNSFVKKCFLK